MPYFKTSQEWLTQSQLLFQAHPETTRITSKYTTKPYTPRQTPTSDALSAPVPRGEIVLKAFDPASGVTLKYRTTKAAEVSRLMGASMGAMGKGMGGVEDGEGDIQMADNAPTTAAHAPADVQGRGAGTPTGGAPAAAAGGGGKKKKKGKK